MHEYLSSTVLSRVKVTDRGKQRLKDAADAGGGARQVAVPGPDEPGPSNYDGFVHGHDAADDGNALGLSGVEQSEVVYLGDGNGSVMEEMGAKLFPLFQDEGRMRLGIWTKYGQNEACYRWTALNLHNKKKWSNSCFR